MTKGIFRAVILRKCILSDQTQRLSLKRTSGIRSRDTQTHRHTQQMGREEYSMQQFPLKEAQRTLQTKPSSGARLEQEVRIPSVLNSQRNIPPCRETVNPNTLRPNTAREGSSASFGTLHGGARSAAPVSKETEKKQVLRSSLKGPRSESQDARSQN